MNAKKYLEKIRIDDERIREKLHELEDLQNRQTVVSAVNYTGIKTVRKSNEASFEKTSDRIIDLINEINRETERFAEERHRIIDQIQSLENYSFSQVLFKRYVEYKTITEIADELNYAYFYVADICGSALKAFAKTFAEQLN